MPILHPMKNIFRQVKQWKRGRSLDIMGDTGYGEEGMSGKFPVHLHLGIYINPQGKEELSVNPYYVLQAMEKKVKKYTY